MTQAEKDFLQAVSCCFEKKRNLPTLDENTLMSVLELSAIHNVLPLMCSELSTVYSESEVLKKYKPAAMRQAMAQMARTNRFLALYRELSARGVRALCVKGITLRTLYVDGECRPSTDEDLLVEKEELSLFCSVMNEQGFSLRKKTETEVSFFDKKTSLIVEANTSLFSLGGDVGKVLSRLFDAPFENMAVMSIDGTEILTLSPRMNVLYLVCHAFKHFIHSGFGIRQVCDIAVFVDKYKNEINFSDLRKSLSQLGAETFFETLIDISANELGFTGLLPLAGRGLADRTDFIEDILKAGVYGRGETSRAHSALLTLSAVENRDGSGSRWHAVFPKRDALAARYPALERFPVLYPCYAALRIAKYAGDVVFNKKGTGTPLGSMEIAKRRLELMKQLKIIPSNAEPKEDTL